VSESDVEFMREHARDAVHAIRSGLLTPASIRSMQTVRDAFERAALAVGIVADLASLATCEEGLVTPSDDEERELDALILRARSILQHTSDL
jgi:hypothetical protein